MDLTNQEKQILLSALDIAVKTLGLNGADTILPIAHKIQASLQDSLPISEPNGTHA